MSKESSPQNESKQIKTKALKAFVLYGKHDFLPLNETDKFQEILKKNKWSLSAEVANNDLILFVGQFPYRWSRFFHSLKSCNETKFFHLLSSRSQKNSFLMDDLKGQCSIHQSWNEKNDDFDWSEFLNKVSYEYFKH